MGTIDDNIFLLIFAWLIKSYEDTTLKNKKEKMSENEWKMNENKLIISEKCLNRRLNGLKWILKGGV